MTIFIMLFSAREPASGGALHATDRLKAEKLMKISY
jgi:hypothetical protein